MGAAGEMTDRSAGARPRCLYATAVWGQWHVQTFIDMNVPTMLAAGNLPAFAALVDTTYAIYTPARDRARMEAAPSIRRMMEVVRVEFRDLTDDEIGAPVATHHHVWNQVMEQARAEAGYVLLMPPDVAWSDGSLGHLAGLIVAGKEAMFLNWHVRSVADTFIRTFLADHEPSADCAIAVPSRDLVRRSLEHVHPMTGAYLRDSRYFPFHPEMIFWPVEGEGLLMHILALVPFVFRADALELLPTRLVGRMGSRDKLHFVVDSDDLYMVSLAELNKDADWYAADARLSYPTVAKWWLYYDSPANDPLVDRPYRLHFAEPTPAKWRRAEASARLAIHGMRSAREVLRLAQAAEHLGCKVAARILHCVVQTGLAKALAGSGEALLVQIPEDAALGAAAGRIDDLLAPINRALLLNALRAHCRPLDAVLPPDATAIAAGRHRVTVVAALQAALPLERVAPRPVPAAPAWRPAPLGDGARILGDFVDAIAGGAPAAALEQRIDAVRHLGIASAQTRRMYRAIGMDPARYRGFDALPQQARLDTAGGDDWRRHREALGRSLPPACAAKLAYDLAEDAAEDRQAETAPSGRAAEAAQRMLKPATFSPPALRDLASARWRQGRGREAATLFDAYLHVPDGSVADFSIRDPQPGLPLLGNYHGCDIVVESGRFVAVRHGASVAPIAASDAADQTTRWLSGLAARLNKASALQAIPGFLALAGKFVLVDLPQIVRYAFAETGLAAAVDGIFQHARHLRRRWRGVVVARDRSLLNLLRQLR